MRNIFKRSEHEKEFADIGYIKIPFLSLNEIQSLRRKVSELSPNDRFVPSTSQNADLKQRGMTLHITVLDANRDYKRRAIEIIEAEFSQRANDLLEDHVFLTANLFVKPPGEGRLDVHRDGFTKDLRQTTVSFWCPLVDCDELNGTIQVIPRSHRVLRGSPSCFPFFANFADTIKKYALPITVKAGECLIFDSSLLHWSDDNRSGDARHVAQAMYIPAEAAAAVYRLDTKAGNIRFEVFPVTRSYFIESTTAEILNRRAASPSLGFVENTNRFLTESEFIEILRKEGTEDVCKLRPTLVSRVSQYVNRSRLLSKLS